MFFRSLFQKPDSPKHCRKKAFPIPGLGKMDVVAGIEALVPRQKICDVHIDIAMRSAICGKRLVIAADVVILSFVIIPLIDRGGQNGKHVDRTVRILRGQRKQFVIVFNENVRIIPLRMHLHVIDAVPEHHDRSFLEVPRSQRLQAIFPTRKDNSRLRGALSALCRTFRRRRCRG